MTQGERPSNDQVNKFKNDLRTYAKRLHDAPSRESKEVVAHVIFNYIAEHKYVLFYYKIFHNVVIQKLVYLHTVEKWAPAMQYLQRIGDHI